MSGQHRGRGRVPPPAAGVPVTRVDALDPDDWRIIRGVRLRALVDAPQAFTSTYEREHGFDEAVWRSRATTCQWFVAFDGDEPVAVAGAVPVRADEPTRRELVGMWVAPTHRRRRIADRLLRQVAAWARSQGASSLCLGVLEGNEEARAAYLRMGLRPAGETAATADDPARSIEFMQLDLADDAG